MIRSLILAAVLASPSAASRAASPSPLWGRLEPGPHAVGFRQLARYDYSRQYRPERGLDGKPQSGERARPMRISIWYPARAVSRGARPLTFGEYVAMVAGERRFGPLTPAQIAEGERTFFQLPILREMTSDQRERLKRMPGRAYRDAIPAEGRFPLILYSLGSAALAHVTPEYLASHGYVVAQMPRVGAYSGCRRTASMPATSRRRSATWIFSSRRCTTSNRQILPRSGLSDSAPADDGVSTSS
jgi:hypothetical protein